MKLQYLGDARDAFKWDLLHWICTRSLPSFSTMVFVPLLTPDVKESNEGLTPHHWFECRDFIRTFVVSLKAEPRSLERIAALGSAETLNRFQVSVFAPETFVGAGGKRSEYWIQFDASKLENSVVFFDPDNGYETETRDGEKWIRHSELRSFFSQLPETSVAVVYQHRPRRTWPDLFADLTKKLTYAHTAIAAYEANLAFVAMAGNATVGRRVATAMEEYAETKNHRKINIHPIVGVTRCS
jgi:hypothetical protein